MASGHLVRGPKVKAFSGALTAYIGRKQAAVTSNGTTAFHLALLTHGIGRG